MSLLLLKPTEVWTLISAVAPTCCRLSEVYALVNGTALLAVRGGSVLAASLDLDRVESLCCVMARPRRLVVPVLLAMGNGGNAQSRFVSSGVGGLREPGIDGLREVGNGDRGPEDALTGEAIELCPLLAGVTSPEKGGGRTVATLV